MVEVNSVKPEAEILGLEWREAQAEDIEPSNVCNNLRNRSLWWCQDQSRR